MTDDERFEKEQRKRDLDDKLKRLIGSDVLDVILQADDPEAAAVAIREVVAKAYFEGYQDAHISELKRRAEK